MDSEFPPLNSSIDLSSYFQEEVVFLYFNSTRKTNPESLETIQIHLSEVISTLKRELIQNRRNGYTDSVFVYMEYLDLIYKLIANTRDIIGGKGEHDLFYMMIYELYRAFPTMAVYLLHNLTTYGCWRDIKYLCNYLRDKKENQNNTNNSAWKNSGFIFVCIDLVNNQLKKDIESWKFSVNAGSRSHISNVAKWIPREKKRFSWLFDMLAIDWSNKYGRWKINNMVFDLDGATYLLALNKVRMEYRKTISKMNKQLDTTEIKLCSGNIAEINPKNVSKYTIMKQPGLFLSNYSTVNPVDYDNPMNEFDKISCSYNYIENIMKDDSYASSSNGEIYGIVQLPISHFVKEAMRINKIDNEGKYKINESELLNKKWQVFSDNFNYKNENILPVIDSSYQMMSYDAESFYHSVGLAILVAEKSYFGKRILALDNSSTWINFSECLDFCSIVKTIDEAISSQRNTAFSIERGIDIIVTALSESNATIKNMKLVIFSNSLADAPFGFGCEAAQMATLPSLVLNEKRCKIDVFYEYLNKQCSTLDLHVPHLLFWNMSKTDVCSLPSCYKNITMVSGFSGFLLKHIHKITFNRSNYSYEMITRILDDKRYDILSEYLKHCIN